jgi:hypothetical protein
MFWPVSALAGRPAGSGVRCGGAWERDGRCGGGRLMATLLIVHHTTSPALQEMFEAVTAGAGTDEVEGVQVVARPALTAAAADVLAADGYLLGTPANIGYMSGALKHFFDGIYYPCLTATVRRPYGLYVHGSSDTTGAVRAVEAVATGLSWRRVHPPVSVTGPPAAADLAACWELGAIMAAELAP